MRTSKLSIFVFALISTFMIACGGGEAPVEEVVAEEEIVEGKSRGVGSIRTLCFRRLSEIFSQFSDTIDFSVYGAPLWASINRSVIMLPETVVRCDKVPALLSLLQTLSSSQPLLPLLSMYDEAVPCVIKCLSDTSSHPVVDSTLTFIDNLLAEDEDIEQGALDLVTGHVDLILRQFI